MDAPSYYSALLAAVAAILVVCVVRIKTKTTTTTKKYHPIGGTIFHLLYNIRRVYHYLTDLTHKNTTFRILYLDNVEIFTSDPANIEYFLKTNFSNYGKV